MIATCLPVVLFRASCTKPKAPLARSLTLAYFSWSAKGSLPIPGGAIVAMRYSRMRWVAWQRGRSTGATRERAPKDEEASSPSSTECGASFIVTLRLFFEMPATDEEERAAEPAAAPAAPATAASDEPGPSSAADSAAQINRPSNKRRRNLRQTRVTAGDDDNDDEGVADGEQGNNKTPARPTVDHATLIEDTRALQKQRGKRTVGILDCFTARRDATRGE